MSAEPPLVCAKAAPKPASNDGLRGNGMSISHGLMVGAAQKKGCGSGMVRERAGGGKGNLGGGQFGQPRGLSGHLGSRHGLPTTPTTPKGVTLNGREQCGNGKEM